MLNVHFFLDVCIVRTEKAIDSVEHIKSDLCL